MKSNVQLLPVSGVQRDAFAGRYRDMKVNEATQAEIPPHCILMVEDDPITRHLNARNVLLGTVPIVMWEACEIGIPIAGSGHQFTENDCKTLHASNTSRVKDRIEPNESPAITKLVIAEKFSPKQ
jgi:ATP-dependent protease HslVU (ClpYQ) ATPase subunit